MHCKLLPPIHRNGFTLIELLVAISILAIVAVLGWRGLDSIVRSRAALTSELEQTRAMQLTFAQMQSDCAQNVNPFNYPNLPEGRSSWIEPQRFTLIRQVFSDNQAPAMAVVTYRLQDAHLTRFESITTNDLSVLNQLLQQARNPPDDQVAVIMQKNVQSVEFSGWPTSSLTLSTSSNSSSAASSSSSSGSTPPVAGVQNVNEARLTTGLQVSLQLEKHEKTILKIFILGGS